MKKIILTLLFAATFAVAGAQDYNWAVGIRGGGRATGITAKYSIDGANALEGILSFTSGVNFYGLYERHMPVISQGFSFYYGAGAHIGSWERHDKDKFTVGADVIVGLEYKIKNAPLAISVDYKPALNIIGHTGFRSMYDFGLGVKAAF